MPLNIDTQLIVKLNAITYCGDGITKTCKSIHKHKYGCKAFQIIPRPSFDEWLIKQGYDKMLWEYGPLFKEPLEQQTNLNQIV